jgi:hypothetical protein
MDFRSIFNEARQNKTYAIIKGYRTDTPSWEDSILNLNYAFTTLTLGNNFHPHLMYNQKDEVVPIISNRKLNIFSLHAIKYFSGEKHDHGGFFPQVDDLIPEINSAFDDFKIYFGKLHLNLVGDDLQYEIHRDDHDVISWQTNGTVEYRIYEEDEVTYESIILEPGDIFYMPTGILHSIVVHEPRTTIIFQLHSLYDQNINW